MSLGPLTAPAADAIGEAMALVPQLRARDYTIWGDDPTEIADRLGWLDAVERAETAAPDLLAHAASVREDGITDVLLVGMGGSSLYPEVLVSSLGPAPGAPRLHVLDSTDPAAVLAVERAVPWETTLLIPASKSGSTIETTAHLDRFWERLVEAHGSAAGTFVLPITDPGSDLDVRARAMDYRDVVHGQPDVGGRFSALSPFGLLPAALLGVDLRRHLAAGADQLDAAMSEDPQVNEPVVLGGILAAAVRAGRDKLTVLLPDEIAAFGLWIEQLIAESTGKHGTGIVPILGETPANATFGDDRLVIAVGEHPEIDQLVAAGVPVVSWPWSGTDQLAGEVVRFEVATAVVGALLSINPFDQPNVAAAKAATDRVLDSGADLPPSVDPDPLLDEVVAGELVALLGFVEPGSDDEATLRQAADQIRTRTRVPVTVGIGPRYLHSTGQLHKGGPDAGLYLVVVGDDPVDAVIPGRDYTFSRLKRAQAAGDLLTLTETGRRAAHVALADLT